MRVNTISAPLEIKEIDAETGVISGYASVFGEEDLGQDIVQRGAFSESLAKRGANGVKMFWQHDPAAPVGKWTEIREDDRGLLVKGRLLLSVSKAREAYEMLKEGLIDGLSIGFNTVKSSADKARQVRLLEKVDLMEISLVTFPMLPSAKVFSVKGERPTEREFEKWLTQDAGFTRSEARTIIASGFKSLSTVRDAGGEGHSEAIDEASMSAAADQLRQLVEAMRQPR